MRKLLLILGLLFLIGCEYKTIDVQQKFTTEDAIVISAKYWTTTRLTPVGKIFVPITDTHYKTIIRSIETGKEYDFHNYKMYKEFKSHQNCKAVIKFKHTLKTQQNRDYETRVLEHVSVQNVYLVED